MSIARLSDVFSVAMLVAMADESGFQTSGYFAMAGYVGTHEEWLALQTDWDHALARHGAPYLHMKEFSGKRGPYAGWTEDQRRALLGDLLHAIARRDLSAFGAAMRVADFEELNPEQREALVGPYFVCWQEMVLGAGLQKIVVFPGEKIDFVYSRQDDFKSKMRWLWEFSKEYRDYGPSLGTLSFQDMRSVAGLQAVDLLVYELRHYYHLRDSRPDLGLRLPFKVLLMHQNALGVHMLKYLPYWLVVAQANGVGEPMLDMVLGDLETYGPMYDELKPPMIDPLRGTDVMRVLEKYIPFAPPDDTRMPRNTMLGRPLRLPGFTVHETKDLLSRIEKRR